MPKVEAYMELRRRHLESPMTPELGYELIKTVYDDEQAALTVKSQLLLSNMPTPKNVTHK